MEQLEGRVAVITGGGSGIGEGLAHACHAAGMRVVLGDVEEDEAARVANDVRELGGDAIAVRADVSSRESLEELARDADLKTVERTVVIGAGYEELLSAAAASAPAVPLAEWDPFCISYTSGTTGNPKGVLLSHRSRSLVFYGMAVEYGCYSPEDRALAVAPLYHGGGFAFAMAPIFFGGTCEILPRFDPEELLRVIAEVAITNAFMVPTHFNAVFGLGDRVVARADTSSLRTIISNAAPLPQATKVRIVEWLGDGILHETYGSTEGGIITNLRPQDQLRKEQCVGQPFPCTEVRLLDDDGEEVPAGEVGEVFNRSPYLFNGGYRRQRHRPSAMAGCRLAIWRARTTKATCTSSTARTT